MLQAPSTCLQVPLVHATWHCLSAVGIASMQQLVNDADARHLELGTSQMPSV